MGQRSPKELVKTHGYAELENGPKMPKESEWAKDAQEERNRTRELTSNEMGQVKTQSSIGIKPMTILSHKQQAQKGPTGTGQIAPPQEQKVVW